MSNNIWIVTHLDARRGTAFAHLDEDRVVRQEKSNWYDGHRLERLLRQRTPWELPLLVVDHTDGNRVIGILRRHGEHDVFADDENAIIARWEEQMVPYTSTSRAMNDDWVVRPPKTWPRDSDAWRRFEAAQHA